MSHRILRYAAAALPLWLPTPVLAAGAVENGGGKLPLNPVAIAMFFVFVAATLAITYWASRRSRTASEFFTAGGGITGFQNGLAISGDAISASTVLGLVSFVYLTGYDGLVSAVGFFVGWPILLLLMADRLRNLGRYTFADIVSFRLDPKPMRCLAAGCGLTVVFFYLIIQIVGAGELIGLLFGLDYTVAVVVVGVLMMIYVTFGGMVATTWVQIIKASLLLFGITLLGILVMSRFGFSFETLAAQAVAANKAGARIMGPGSFMADPVAALSLSIGSVCGISGLPHILMRFFTVPDAKAARMSVFYASGFIGYAFLLSGILGLAGMALVGTDPQFFEGGIVGGKLLGGANLISLHLAKLTGGDLLLGFLSAVLFATILAVVSGLALSGAAAISHDLYANVFRKGRTTEASEVRVTKIATLVPGRRDDRARDPVQGTEPDIPDHPDVRHRRFRQLSRAAAVDVLERPDHARRVVGRVERAGQRAGAGDPGARGVEGGSRPSRRDLPLRRPGPVLDAARLPDGLRHVPHRPQRSGRARAHDV